MGARNAPDIGRIPDPQRAERSEAVPTHQRGIAVPILGGLHQCYRELLEGNIAPGRANYPVRHAWVVESLTHLRQIMDN